jgi:excisionase family DNA binding protein
LVRNDGKGWLTLGQASRTLGVTPNTLRRWADRGQISSFTTPGGHRRFLDAAVQALVPAGRARRPPLAASPDRMARAYRRARPLAEAQGQEGWLGAISESERQDFRRRGMQLVGDLLAGLDADGEKAASLLATAEKRASDYGAVAASLGASLSDTVEGFLRFRKPFVDELAVLARRRHLDTREATALMVEAESTLDRLLVALMVGHAAPRSTP